MNIQVEIVFLPKHKTLLGLGYMSGEAKNTQDEDVTFYEIGIGFLLINFYFIIYKK
jgi:hypothetical protein